MTKTVKVNDHVLVPVTKARGVSEAKQRFGSSWKTATETGEVLEKLNRSVRVRLKDGTLVTLGTRLVKKVGCQTVCDSGGASSEGDGGSDAEVDTNKAGSSDSSSSDDSSDSGESEEDNLEGLVENQDAVQEESKDDQDMLLQPHGLVWKREEVHQDIREPTRHVPKLNWGHQLDGAKTELSFLCTLTII